MKGKRERVEGTLTNLQTFNDTFFFQISARIITPPSVYSVYESRQREYIHENERNYIK